jgi:phosphoglycolate phosphatase-like HAD superfamily hydrolase
MSLNHVRAYLFTGSAVVSLLKVSRLSISEQLVQAAPHEALMVGDSDVDIKTARNAGMYACGVTHGFGVEGLRAHPPDIMLDSLSDLPAHLK